MSRSSTLTFLTALACLLGACGGPPRPEPRTIVKAYSNALTAGDIDRAYELMSPRFRAQVSRRDFAKRVKADEKSLATAANRLRGGSVQWRAVLEGQRGESIHLVREDGRWRLDDDPTQRYSQRTPANALRSFVRALELRRYDRVLGLLCEKQRKRSTRATIEEKLGGENAGETALLAKNLRAHLADEILMEGETAARLPYGPRSEARLARERGSWCVLDPD